MPIEERKISDVAVEAAARYSRYVTLNRQFSDFRDGLLPVQRHIIWASHKLDQSRSGKYFKTAKIVGDVLGNYHPHSGEAIADSVAGLTRVKSMVNPMEGDGNFGNRMGDPPADMRYTDARLSAYGTTFVDKAYLKCVPYVWNYSGTERIPVYLPALLPNILLNGTFGIGYGAMACVPSFTPESVAKIVDLAFKRDIKPSDCVKILEPCFISDATLEMTDGLAAFYSTGTGSFKVLPKCEIVDGDVLITGFYELNLASLVEKLTTDPLVRDVSDISDDVSKVLVQVRNKNKVNTRKVYQLVMSELTFTKALQANIIENDIPDGYESDNETLPSKFTMYTLPDLIHKWVDYRARLEKKMLEILRAETHVQRHRVSALIAAVEHLTELTKLLKADITTPELKIRVGKLLNADEDSVNHLLVNTSMLRLSRVDHNETRKTFTELTTKIRRIDHALSDINKSTRESIARSFAALR